MDGSSESYNAARPLLAAAAADGEVALKPKVAAQLVHEHNANSPNPHRMLPRKATFSSATMSSTNLDRSIVDPSIHSCPVKASSNSIAIETKGFKLRGAGSS